MELHMFGDSSQDAFCAVGFLRACSHEDRKTLIAFVFGEARVAPMKALSIPKLELQAALLATRLKNQLTSALSLNVQRVYLWTDSTTVLQWLNSTEKQPVFVANRVAEILETTTIDQWFHVSTSDNPADVGTRGLAANLLKDSCWIKGPEFLRTSEWPFRPNMDVLQSIRLINSSSDVSEVTGANETSTLIGGSANLGNIINWNRFVSYGKTIRTICYTLRLLKHHQHFRTSSKKVEDPEELRIAETKVHVAVQNESFQAEMKALKLGDNVSKSSKIAVYSPFIGPGGVIRALGRLKRLDNSPFDVKHPVILDGRHALVKLFVLHLHELHFHQGVDYIRAQLQQRFLILRLRIVLRAVQSRCIVCRKRRAEVINPIMADLPKERLGYQRPPFTFCGIDYFGPLYVTVKRSSEKRWAFLFTCMTTRAVHLEVVPSLDTSSCVMGIERFISRRGTPAVIWSDNGTNFVGAEKEIVDCIRRWNKEAPSSLVHRSIKWKFNPPSAPHHGGSWERMVRSVKRVFYAILGNRKLKDEVLSTALCLVEQALNARPLTPLSDNPDQLEALTPNHFLVAKPGTPFPSLNNDDTVDHKRRYTKYQAYANAIWTRWLREYVPSLNKRTKWCSRTEDQLKIGELVWIAEDSNPRGHYPLARIEALIYGADSIARSATLRTASTTLSRPVVKLVRVFGSSSSLGPEDVAAA